MHPNQEPVSDFELEDDPYKLDIIMEFVGIILSLLEIDTDSVNRVCVDIPARKSLKRIAI